LATIKPFQAYRYTSKAGDPAKLLTQPYDKISPEMRTRYLAASPHNLVRVILGESQPTDNADNNVYTRAGDHFRTWIGEGLLARDAAPAFYFYTQEFEVPDSGEIATRTGFIGLGKVEDYSANVVYRHEHTLSGPKKDRRQVLDHTHAHFGQIFMLYPDRPGEVDQFLQDSIQGPPVMDVVDDYKARHRLWAVTDPAVIERVQSLMADKKLLIADGHHRYETALGYRNDHPSDPAAQYVMMTFVNMYSPGLRILATHRVLRNVQRFDAAALLDEARKTWKVTRFDRPLELKRTMGGGSPSSVRIGIVTAGGADLLERARKDGELDVPLLHTEVLGGLLKISEEAVREEKFIKYVRGFDAAVAEVRDKDAQAAFLLEPTPIEEMARVAFGGGVMPQKSTDFYPKLLTGIAIYKLD
jgi:uncharacterized protein (DUF1015 family)